MAWRLLLVAIVAYLAARLVARLRLVVLPLLAALLLSSLRAAGGTAAPAGLALAGGRLDGAGGCPAGAGQHASLPIQPGCAVILAASGVGSTRLALHSFPRRSWAAT
jgi:hypothetical protein